MERLYEKIDTSTFARKLIIESKGIFADHLGIFANPDTRPSTVEYSEYGTVPELRLKHIFNRYDNISNYFEKLILIKSFLNAEDAEEFCKNNSIDEIKYYQYHLENFIIRLVGLLDLCAKLGNEVYNLGLSDRSCNRFTFTNDSQLVGKECITILNEFFVYLDTLVTDRHIIVHAGGYTSSVVESIESRIINNDLIEMTELLTEWFSEQKTAEIVKLVEEVDDKINHALEFVFNFLDSMESDL